MAIEEETVIRREGTVMLIVFFGGLICALNTGPMYMAYLKLMEVFHTDLSTVQWLTVMFAVTSAMVTPTASYFARRYSLRNALMAALVVMTAASFCCTLAPNIHSLIVCRALQGAASGMMTPLTMAIIYQWIPKEKQGRFLSMSLMGMSLGPAIGPTLSGFFLATVGWQAIFLCNVPITLLNLYLVFRVVPREAGNGGDSLDYNSMITVFSGTMLILLSFYQAGRIGWAQPVIGLGILLGSALLYLFVRRQLRAEKPMLDFRIFHSRKFTVSVIVSAVLYANVTLIAFLMPIFLQKAKGMEPLPAGMLLFFPAVGMALTTPLAGRVYEKVSARTMLLAGLGAMLLGNCLITGFCADTAPLVLVGCLMIRYVGAAFANVPSLDYGLGDLPKHKASEGTAMNNWIKSMGNSMALSIFTALYSLQESRYIPALMADGMSQAAAAVQAAAQINSNLFWIKAVTLIFALVLVVLATEKQKKQRKPK